MVEDALCPLIADGDCGRQDKCAVSYPSHDLQTKNGLPRTGCGNDVYSIVLQIRRELLKQTILVGPPLAPKLHFGREARRFLIKRHRPHRMHRLYGYLWRQVLTSGEGCGVVIRWRKLEA